MKKRLFPIFISFCVLVSLAMVPAYAYTESVTPNITVSGDKIIFKGTTRTNALPASVEYIQTKLYVYDFASSRVFFNTDDHDDKVDYLTVTRIADKGNYWYHNEATGVIEYFDGTRFHDVKTIARNLMTSGASLYTTTTYETLANFHHSQRNEILTNFGYDSKDYDFYLYTDLSEALTAWEYISIREQLGLAPGDTIPGFYVDVANNKIIAVNENDTGENQLFVFEKNMDGDWELTS